MGLFDRNPNETAFVHGKKHWTDVIKNSGPGELLIWRQPEEDFNTKSTLVVMPGEEAIFIKGGTVEQTFENGTYQLDSENYPFIGRLRNAFSGGVSTFNCVVYFVRTAHSMEILWGTESPIQVRDKVLGIATKLRARGSYKIKIGNPVIFLEKLIGNNIPFEYQQELNKYFINEFQSKIKSIIARALMESDTEILGIDSRLDEFSDIMQPYMAEILDDYGLKCEKFSISAIDIDDNELRRAYDQIGIDKAAMDLLGDDWGRQQAANILGNLAVNPGAGGVAAAGAGMGMGMAAGGAFGSMAQQMFAPMTSASQTSIAGQDAVSQSAAQRFAPKQNEVEATQTAKEDPVEVLGKLKRMLDAGLIEVDEYEAKKAEILSRM